MSKKPNELSPEELREQIERIINPVGPLGLPGAPPGTKPVRHTIIPGWEEHKKKKEKEKKGSVFGSIGKVVPGSIGDHLRRNAHTYDLAGLGVLAAPAAVELGHEVKKEKGTRDLGNIGKSTAELAGLALLAAPVAAQMKHACVDELQKLGFVTDEQAIEALEQMRTLEAGQPTGGQLARGMALGAVAKPVINVAANAIKGGVPLLEGAGPSGKLRALASHAMQGAVGGGALSVAQNEVERRHALGKLRKYVEQANEKD